MEETSDTSGDGNSYDEFQPREGKPSAKWGSRLLKKTSSLANTNKQKKKGLKDKRIMQQKERKEQRHFKEFDVLPLVGLQTGTSKLVLSDDEGHEVISFPGSKAKSRSSDLASKLSNESNALVKLSPIRYLSGHTIQTSGGKEQMRADKTEWHVVLDDFMHHSEEDGIDGTLQVAREKAADLKKLLESVPAECEDSWTAREDFMDTFLETITALRGIKTTLQSSDLLEEDSSQYDDIVKDLTQPVFALAQSCCSALREGFQTMLGGDTKQILDAFRLAEMFLFLVDCLVAKKDPLISFNQKEFHATSSKLGGMSREIAICVTQGMRDYQKSFFDASGSATSAHEVQDRCRQLQAGWDKAAQLADLASKTFPREAILIARERCETILRAARAADEMQRAFPGFKDLVNEKATGQSGGPRGGVWGGQQLYDPKSKRTPVTDSIMQAQAWIPCCLKRLLAEANKAAEALDITSKESCDKGMLDQMSEVLHRLAITTNCRLGGLHLDSANLSHWALQAFEEQACQAASFVIELDKGVLGGTDVSIHFYGDIRDTTVTLVNSALHVRHLLRQKEALSEIGALKKSTAKVSAPHKPKLRSEQAKPSGKPASSKLPNKSAPSSPDHPRKATKAINIPKSRHKRPTSPSSSDAFEDSLARWDGDKEERLSTPPVMPVLGESPTNSKAAKAIGTRKQSPKVAAVKRTPIIPKLPVESDEEDPQISSPTNKSDVRQHFHATLDPVPEEPSQLCFSSSSPSNNQTQNGPLASPKASNKTPSSLAKASEFQPLQLKAVFSSTGANLKGLAIDNGLIRFGFHCTEPMPEPSESGLTAHSPFLQASMAKPTSITADGGNDQKEAKLPNSTPPAESKGAEPSTPQTASKGSLSKQLSDSAKRLRPRNSQNKLELRESGSPRAIQHFGIRTVSEQYVERIPQKRRDIAFTGPRSDPSQGYHISQAAAAIHIAERRSDRASTDSPTPSCSSASTSVYLSASPTTSSSQSEDSSNGEIMNLDDKRNQVAKLSEKEYTEIYKRFQKWTSDPFWNIPWTDLRKNSMVQPDAGKPVPRLGAGSYASVFVGSYHGSTVAIKIFSFENAGLKESLKIFKREVDLQKQLSVFQHVVRFSGACCDLPATEPQGEDMSNVNLAIVMELCQNGSLHSVIRAAAELERKVPRDVIYRRREPDGPMQTNLMRNNKGLRPYTDWRCRVLMAKQAASAVEFMHSKDISHRDLTSSNVLVTHNYEAKVADFGLSAALHEKSDVLLNSLCWAAPEKLMMKENIDTKAADVFSFGVVLWELITLQQPWARYNDAPVRQPENEEESIRERDFFVRDIYAKTHVPQGARLRLPEVNEIYPVLPELPLLNELVEACWQSEPGDRPSMVTIVARLTDILRQIDQRKRESRMKSTRPPQ